MGIDYYHNLKDILSKAGIIYGDFAYVVLVFFAYAFLGYIMECIVLSIEKRKLVINRGFSAHLPFCIIYGFGAIIGHALLVPFENNLFMLFVFGALGATGFEWLVAKMQILLFGNFWWDYSEKPFNYKGMLCLESTLGWGIIGILVVKMLHGVVLHTVQLIPLNAAKITALIVFLVYLIDFAISSVYARRRKRQLLEEQVRINNKANIKNETEYYSR